MNWPSDATPLHTLGHPPGIRWAAAPAKATEERRGALRTCPASSGATYGSLGPSGILRQRGTPACFSRVAVVLWASTDISVSKSAFGPGSVEMAGPKSEGRWARQAGQGLLAD